MTYSNKDIEDEVLHLLTKHKTDPYFTEDRLVNSILYYLYQYLQNARKDWLRKEIVRLEGKKIYRTDLDSKRLGYEKSAYNRALQTVIDSYQAEISQLK